MKINRSLSEEFGERGQGGALVCFLNISIKGLNLKTLISYYDGPMTPQNQQTQHPELLSDKGL